MSNCSKVICPFNSLTFKNCNMTENECKYYTKGLTNGDVMKVMFPEDLWLHIYARRAKKSEGWWNSPYKRGETNE